MYFLQRLGYLGGEHLVALGAAHSAIDIEVTPARATFGAADGVRIVILVSRKITGCGKRLHGYP